MKTDTRGTREPSAKTLLRRANKAEQQRLAVQSAQEAGYRRGYEDRCHNSREDAEINILRNRIAAVQAETAAIMDREFAKGFLETLAAHNKHCPDVAVTMMATNHLNAIARELTRAYDKEKQT